MNRLLDPFVEAILTSSCIYCVNIVVKSMPLVIENLDLALSVASVLDAFSRLKVIMRRVRYE